MAYPRLDSVGLTTLLTRLVTDGDLRWAKKNELPGLASANADGLMSSSDFTKLSGIATGAEANVLESVSVNGTALPITNKGVDVTVPTAVSSLTNDSNFQTDTEVASAIAAAVADITQFDYEVVASLPATGEKGIIYLVSNSGTGSNVYDEYIWMSGDPGRFEKIGTTDIDLSGYVQATEMTTIPDADIIAAVNAAFGVSA
jgi:hypothetical protein